jgi:NAD-dependent SIR2 family protein deacetylase
MIYTFKCTKCNVVYEVYTNDYNKKIECCTKCGGTSTKVPSLNADLNKPWAKQARNV